MTAGQVDGRPRRGASASTLVTGRIGRGGMGMVYRGCDEVLEREVAVKTLTVEGTPRRGEPPALRRSRPRRRPGCSTPTSSPSSSWARTAACPTSPWSCCPGSDLEALLRSGEPLLLQEKLDIVIQVCRGLHYAHEHAHRPPRHQALQHPACSRTARRRSWTSASPSWAAPASPRAGMMVGTVHYMSPEQVRGPAARRAQRRLLGRA